MQIENITNNKINYFHLLTPFQGLARSVLALSTILILIFNDFSVIGIRSAKHQVLENGLIKFKSQQVAVNIANRFPVVAFAR